MGGGGGGVSEAGGVHIFIHDPSTSKAEMGACFTRFGAKMTLQQISCMGGGKRASRVLQSLKIGRP